MSYTHTISRLEPVVLVAVGGFAGSNLRYLLTLVVPSSMLAVLVANTAGSFALGVLLHEAMREGVSAQARLVLGTGFLASFTTYSTFALQAFAASLPLAVAYVGASYTLGFGAVAVSRVLVFRSEAH